MELLYATCSSDGCLLDLCIAHYDRHASFELILGRSSECFGCCRALGEVFTLVGRALGGGFLEGYNEVASAQPSPVTQMDLLKVG